MGYTMIVMMIFHMYNVTLNLLVSLIILIII